MIAHLHKAMMMSTVSNMKNITSNVALYIETSSKNIINPKCFSNIPPSTFIEPFISLPFLPFPPERNEFLPIDFYRFL